MCDTWETWKETFELEVQICFQSHASRLALKPVALECSESNLGHHEKFVLHSLLPNNMYMYG